VNKLEKSFDLINAGTKPLAAYLFTNDIKFKEQFVKNVSPVEWVHTMENSPLMPLLTERQFFIAALQAIHR
ncbi:hypothetical protein RYX36_014956, partial [Vicia faba]